MCQINIYLGLLDLITYNAKKNFISKEFKQYTTIIGISIKGVLVKAHNFIGIVERYYSLLQRAYQIIITEIPKINKEIGL